MRRGIWANREHVLRAQQNDRPLGVEANFEQASRACAGEFVALCDQDDIWDASRRARLVEVLQERPYLLLVHSDARLVDAQGHRPDASLFRTLAVSRAELLHHEAATRGDDVAPEKQARFGRAVAWMRERWGALIDGDPAYNPNLTLASEDFGLAWPPRCPR